MPASDVRTLRLDGALELGRIAALWPTLRGRCSGVERIDLSAVTGIDSSGVALVRCLQSLAAASGKRPEVVGGPPRRAQIGLAHRVDADGD